MYMSMKFTSTLTALSMALLVACSSSSSATATKVAVPEPAAVDSNFVTQQGNKLMLNGKEYRIAGTNNYYMHYGEDRKSVV